LINLFELYDDAGTYQLQMGDSTWLIWESMQWL